MQLRFFLCFLVYFGFTTATGFALTTAKDSTIAPDSSAAVSTPADHQASYDLPAALKRAEQANKEIQAAAADLLGAQASQGTTRSALLPQAYVTFNAKSQHSFQDKEQHTDYIDQNTKTARAGVRQTLLDMPAYSRYQGSILEKERANIYLRYVRFNVLYKTERQFFLYLRARENVKSYQKAVERMQQQVEAAQAFYKRQLKPRLHVLQMQTQLSKAESQLVQARNAVRTQKSRLDGLLALPESNNVEFIGALSNTQIHPLKDLPVYIARALDQRPDVTIRQKDVDISRQSERIVRGGFFPTVSLSAEGIRYDVNYENSRHKDRDHEYYTLGVNASWNLFQSGHSFYSLRSQKQKTRAASLRLEKLREDVATQVKESYLNVRQYEEQIALARIYVREASETWERAEHGYRLGVSTSTDLVDAARSLVDAEVTLNMALADYNIARADLAHACGLGSSVLPMAEK